MSRDNAAATSGKLTLRFGYQLLSEPCTAAAQVAAVLRLRGWLDSPRPCSSTCPVASITEPIRGGFLAHSLADDSPQTRLASGEGAEVWGYVDGVLAEDGEGDGV